jgi:hypothetical protein
MYDTIAIFLPGATVQDEVLADVSFHAFAHTDRISSTGYCRNMRVTQKRNGILVKGSIPRYFYGHNIDTLVRDDVKPAFEMLSDALHVHVEGGIVKRVDVAATFQMTHEPAAYLPILENLPRTKRVSHADETVSFINRGKSIVVYDKCRQLFSSGSSSLNLDRESMKTLFGLLPRNLLRYECQFKNVGLMFPDGLRASQLADDRVYAAFVTRWKEEYFSIAKSANTGNHPVAINTAKDVLLSLASAGLQEMGGLGRGLELISRTVTLTAMQKTRARKKLRALAVMNENTSDVDLVGDLDSAVEFAASAALGGGGGIGSLFRIGNIKRFLQRPE